MIEIVFFDAGETILRPYPSFPELFAQTCRRHGYEVDPADVKALQDRLGPLIDVAQGSGVEDASLSADASLEFWTFLYRRLLGELGLDVSLAPEFYKVFSDSSSYKLFDDVRPTFDRVAADGYRLGLISNFEGWLEKMLVELEVGHDFDVSVISGLVGVEKPDPRIYEIALEKARVEPDRAVHVGDSLRTDVEPALATGMHAVLIDRLRGRQPTDSGSNWDVGGQRWPTIRTLEELPELIAKL